MEENKLTVLVYYDFFKKGKNATEMQTKLGAAYREGAVTDGMCQKRFAKFLGTTDILAKPLFAVGLPHALEDVEQHPWPLPTRSQ